MTTLATERTTANIQVAYLYAISHLAHWGERSASKLKMKFPTYGSWSELTSAERDNATRRLLGNDSPTVFAKNFDSLIDRAITDIRNHEREGIRVLSIDSDEYPQLLKLIPDSPLVLFVKGSIDSISHNSSVAVVGTRDSTSAGEKVASKVAKWLGEHGWCVVSGLAKGIDSAAHKGALDARGKTAAVMATPLNKVYPAENRQLANDILDGGGCWLGELPLWKKPHRSSFVQRDRIQSGISVAVIPVQTDLEGGTMHTVRFAEQQNRLLLCPRPIEAERLVKQYAGIRHLIDTRRAVPFSGDDYSKIGESMLNHREILLKTSTLEPRETIATPDISVSDLPKDPTSLEADEKPKTTPKRTKRPRLQMGLGFIADEPAITKPKNKKVKTKGVKVIPRQEPLLDNNLGEENRVAMTAKHWIERAAHYRNEILQEIGTVTTIDSSDRSRVATAFIKMAVGDFNAILTEIGSDNPGPAFKLFRLLYEDVVNGLWAQAFAKDELIDRLLHGRDGQMPGHIADRAQELDTVFVGGSDLEPDDGGSLFVHFQSKFWKTANSYTHGGSMAINRELAGYDHKSIYEILRGSTTLIIMFIDAMYRLHYKRPNDVLTVIAQTYFAEQW